MQQKVVIIGHSYSSRLSIIRSVAEIGCDVTVISLVWYKRNTTKLNKEKQIDCYSRYVSRVLYCYRKGEKELIDLLLAECKESDHKPIIIPDTDFSAATIDKYKERLSPYFLFPSIRKGFGDVRQWMDKTIQKDLAIKTGLSVADSSAVVEIKDGHYSIPLGIKYPCYTKALATIVGGKGGMRKCDNENDLQSALNFLCREKDMQVLVEEYKVIDKEYAVLGFSDGQNVLIPGAIQQLIVSKKNKGIAMTGRVMPAEQFEDLIDKFRQFVLATGFVGIFDIDFFLSGGKYYFCEMNLRFGGSGYAITKMGVNLPAMLVRSLRGESIDDMQQAFTGTATYVNERMCMDDWQNGFITTLEFHNAIENADIRFVRDERDPEPERQFKKTIIKYRLKRFVKTCLHKLK